MANKDREQQPARDTHFQGFAQLIFDDLPWGDINIDMEKKGWEDRWLKVLAQRAYDFACHVAMHTSLKAHGDMRKIPDMDKLPEEP